MGNIASSEKRESGRLRQQSITSQLFPGRHQARSKRSWQPEGLLPSHLPVTEEQSASEERAPPLFKSDYTLHPSGEEPATPNLAALKIDSRSQPLRSPGPSLATVEHSTLAASTPELAVQGHRPSINALKKSLCQSHLAGNAGSVLSTSSPSIDIPPATTTSSNPLLAVRDETPKSSPASESTHEVDEFIESSEVVLNEVLVDSMVQNDLRRKLMQQNHSNSTPSMLSAKKHPLSCVSPKKSTLEAVEPVDQEATSLIASEDAAEPKSTKPASGKQPQSSEIRSAEVPKDRFVHVILKWRDTVLDSKSKILVISNDIASVVQPDTKRNKIPMVYSKEEQCWTVPDLKLPAGIYKLQFYINGEIRHSNYLPTATDSLSTIVNWFEVIPLYDEIEPYRDAAIQPYPSKEHSRSENALSFMNELPSPPAVRPPLVNRGGSSFSRARAIERSNTPISDYTGVLSRNESVKTVLSLNNLDLGPHNSKTSNLVYSSDIPELFKVTPAKTDSEGTTPESTSEDPTPAPTDADAPSFTNNVQDCNQDELFRYLQEDWNMSAQEAEEVFLEKYTVPDLPVYLNSTYLNEIFNKLQQNNSMSDLAKRKSLTHIIPHVNLNHLLTSSIRDEIISVGCTTRYEGKFITQIMYAPCYYKK
ncbi:HFL201Cp [Eremothecium sinecaudum]|uniref:HFL201Cp n=1 Tax=Eremothecium sinecaudum TaxID=45286 RepID=A0A0X8HUE1_9SACH|nr:HFL201Cp [Eremothecium sinecaudum]AMD21655.1 HFL201Cp [Eremothecium sinecaudum]